MINGYWRNDKLNQRLFDSIFAAQIAYEANGADRRELLRKEARKALGAYRRTLDRIVALDDGKLDRFFEKVCESYGI